MPPSKHSSGSMNTEQLVGLIRTASNAYYNGEPIMDDEEFDYLVEELAQNDPHHPIVTGAEIGAPVPGYGLYDRPLNTRGKLSENNPTKTQLRSAYMAAVDLPFPMGSLDKVKEDAGLKKWTTSFPADKYLVSDKLDGVSAMLHIEARTPPSPSPSSSTSTCNLYTRGDGKRGRNISHLLSVLDLKQFVEPLSNAFTSSDRYEVDLQESGDPVMASILKHVDQDIAIRGELVIPRKSYAELKPSLGSDKAPARNLVSGVVNAKQPNLNILKHVRFVPYEIVAPDGIPPSEQYELFDHLLKGKKTSRSSSSSSSSSSNGGKGSSFAVFNTHIDKTQMNSQFLVGLLERRRKESEFEIDGIVIRHPDAAAERTAATTTVAKRRNEQRLNPDNAIAFKSRQTDNLAEVRVSNIEWNISKDGLLKPVVQFERSIKLSGADVRQATGFNAAFIRDKVLGPGAVVSVTRSGDVIPHIVDVLAPAENGEPALPSVADWQWEWTPSRVDIRVRSATGFASDELQVRLLTHFLKELGIKGVSEAAVRKLHWAEINTPGKLLHASFETLDSVQGFGQGTTDLVWSELRRVAPIDNKSNFAVVEDCIQLMKASNAFGSGFGTQRLKAILSTAPGSKAAAVMLMVTNGRPLDTSQLPRAKEISDCTPGVHDATAKAFLEGIERFSNFMMENKVKCSALPPPPAAESYLSNTSKGSVHNVVFSGFRDRKLENDIEAAGGRVLGSVSRNTTAVIVPENDNKETTKTRIAKEYGIPVMSISEFVESFVSKNQ